MTKSKDDVLLLVRKKVKARHDQAKEYGNIAAKIANDIAEDRATMKRTLETLLITASWGVLVLVVICPSRKECIRECVGRTEGTPEATSK